MEKIRCVVDPAVADLVPQYLEARSGDIAAITELLAREAMDEVWRYGHQLAGSGKVFGFDQISSIGRAIADAAERGDPRAVAEALGTLSEFLQALELVMPTPQ